MRYPSGAYPIHVGFGEVRPAAMMISAGLADPRMKIEIEVTALKRSLA
jgi:enamine deaminase RidA (YjgF/YER057c/UK114 family)